MGKMMDMVKMAEIEKLVDSAEIDAIAIGAKRAIG